MVVTIRRARGLARAGLRCQSGCLEGFSTAEEAVVDEVAQPARTSVDPRARWRTLPPRTRPEDTIAELDVGPVPDLGPSEDPNRAAVLRFPFPGV